MTDLSKVVGQHREQAVQGRNSAISARQAAEDALSRAHTRAEYFKAREALLSEAAAIAGRIATLDSAYKKGN